MATQARPELTAEQERFVRMEAHGIPTPEMIKALFDIDPDDSRYHGAECKLSRWRKHPKYEEVWKDEVRKVCFSDLVLAQNTLRKSMKSQDGWLAMQSAVNVMGNATKRVFGNEDNTVTVQITGMPDIGSPDQDE
jgi:hypothetical protein